MFNLKYLINLIFINTLKKFYKFVFLMFYSMLLSPDTIATDFGSTGVLSNDQTGSLLVYLPSGSTIVVNDSLNTLEYQDLYKNHPPFLDPSAFVNLSDTNNTMYAIRPYNTYTLVVKGAGNYTFGVHDPDHEANWISTTSLDLMAALYANAGNAQPFSINSPTTNFVAVSDDISNSGSANPYNLHYINNSSECVTFTLVYFSWWDGGRTGNVNITGSGPGNIVSGSCSNLGPSNTDTQSSMQYQASQLRSAFNTQTVAANFALNYDCNVFDVKGMCISAGGRYTTIDNPNINNSAAVVTLGYKVNPNIRIGTYLDQNIHISNPTGIDISNNTPLMGLYAVWNKEQSGLGYQVRLANTYQDKDVTSTRTVFDTSEAGSGKSSLQSQSYLAELSYAFQYQDKTLVRTYAGLRYTHLKQKGYTEDTTDTVTDPLTVAALRDKGITALLGLKINRSLTDKTTLTAQLGLEQDVHHKVDNYSATDLNGSDLTAIAFNSNIKRTRPVASIGAFYDVTKTQRASATINYQQTPFHSTGSATAYFNYMIGF
ncbi:autotransporter outer membrane beta-barrel domain-containing protein [Candidatus Methylopumilus universalis]|nr:autotransporter outer membrane beta-barrel domain-containing protein [Candidatus Methylopumilus universalis]